MLFHADRNVKDNLLQMYKRDALDHYEKKNEIKNRRVNEEKEMLDNLSRKEQQEEDRRKLEKYKRVTDAMNDYKDMVSRKEEAKSKKRKNEDVNFNTYGVNSKQFGNTVNYGNPHVGSHGNQYENFSQQNFNNYEQNYGQNIQNLNYAQNSQNSQNFQNIPQNKNFGSDEISRIQKYEQQKNYKDFLDSQMSQRHIKKPHSKDLEYLTNYSNPYNNKNYEIGGSVLNHNPIINPTNNFNYNKYLNTLNTGNINNLQQQMQPVESNSFNNSNYNGNNLQINYTSKNYMENNSSINNNSYNAINNPYENNFKNNHMTYDQNNLSNGHTPSGQRFRMAANNIIS